MILLCWMLSCTVLYGKDKYRILFLNTETVMVDNRLLHVGDTLSDSQQIHWSCERQAMKVANLRTHGQRVLVANKDMLRKPCTLSAMLSSVRSLSTRDGQILTIYHLHEALGGEIVLADSVKHEVAFPVDAAHYFFISYRYQGEIIYKMLPQMPGYFVIDRSIFFIDGKAIEPFSTIVSIYYQDGDERRLVAEDCSLVVVPLFL